MTLTTNTSRITGISDIKERNRSLGYHFFDADTMRFFGSRILTGIHPALGGSAYFIRSENYAWRGIRRYFVSLAHTSGKVDIVEQPEDGFATSRQARKHADKLACASWQGAPQ